MILTQERNEADVVINKDWRIQVAETRTVYCKHVRQVKLRKQGRALRRLGQVAQGNNGQPSVR